MKKRLLLGSAIVMAAALTFTPAAGPLVTNEVVAEAATGFTGLKKASNGTWYYYKNGKKVTTGTDIVKNQYGWWYVKNGKIDRTYNGIAINKNGAFKIKNGKVNFKANGTYKDADNTYTIKNGKVMSATFDFGKQIKKESAAVALVPEAADINITAKDEKGASGVILVKAIAENEYTLNALVAGNKVILTAKDGQTISSVKSSNPATAIAVSGKEASFVPAALDLTGKTKGEKITVTMKDGTSYVINTWNDKLCNFQVTKDKVANKGAYTFAIDKFLLRVNTEGELIYYRDMNCTGEGKMTENFAAQDTLEGERYYTAFVELHTAYRNVMGGFSSGEYIVMDKNYKDIDVEYLNATDEHGAGYLDQHEFVVLGEDHYINLSYSPVFVRNLPKGTGINGSTCGYVWSGIIQEVEDGKVKTEIDTSDYKLLYDSAVEKRDYKNSTNQGVMANNGQTDVFSLADGWQDYVHINSADYVLNKDGSLSKVLVSMRDQSAVYQFDAASGKIDWILGGKASTLTGYEAYTDKRTDDDRVPFDALTFGQHYARYCNRNADGTLTGDALISIFDNQTGIGPFLTTPTFPGAPVTKTRVFQATISGKTATISNVINGMDLNANGKYHIASHCGSVDYAKDGSALIGWGLHGVIDNMPSIPVVGLDDANYPEMGKLHQGSRPVFSEVEPGNKITFELSVTRNPNVQSHEALFSYRTYKTAD